ncbi:ankyrin repeat domain-containing protein [Flexithrix dorotheae]|uniref:ankyrin repeat domain-containing protein n=1 Tax=Flexithrix dorotheae TaxID=70993 RepID=UPI00036E7B7A|nr:ankyrin repeat domain-containing protein [Flexithrix dorotheae]
MKTTVLILFLALFFSPLAYSQTEDQKLIQALENCNLAELTAALKNGADIQVTDEKGMTPLHLGVICGNPDIVKVLLFYKADVNAKDHFQMSALDYALLSENQQIINLLQEVPHLMVKDQI